MGPNQTPNTRVNLTTETASKISNTEQPSVSAPNLGTSVQVEQTLAKAELPQNAKNRITIKSVFRNLLDTASDVGLTLKVGATNMLEGLGVKNSTFTILNSFYLGASLYINAKIVQGMLGIITESGDKFSDLVTYSLAFGLTQFVGAYLASNTEKQRMTFEFGSEERTTRKLQKALSGKSYEEIKVSGLAGLVSGVSENLWRFSASSSELARIVQISTGLTLTMTYLLQYATAPVFAGALISALIPLFQNLHIASRATSDEKVITEPRRKNWWLRWMLVNHNSAKDIRMLGLEDTLQEKRAVEVEKVVNPMRARAHLNHVYNLFSNPITSICSISTFYFLARGLEVGAIEQASALAIATFFYPNFVGLLSEASNNVGKLLEHAPHIKNFNTVVNEQTNKNNSPDEISNQTNTQNLSLEIDRKPEAPTIDLYNACYAYLKSDGNRSSKEVVQNVSLSINPGEMVMICGDNGVGKSTLFEVLVGLRELTSGDFLVNGSLILSKEQKKEWANNLGVCFQDFFLFGSLTFRQILTLGANPVSEEYFQKVLDVAGVNEFLSETDNEGVPLFPLGLESIYGAEFTNGHELSGGQRQKVSVARALLRRPSVIVLDEFTSNLDPELSNRLYEFLVFRDEKDHMGYQPTVLFTSHDYRKARETDRVIFLWKDEQNNTHTTAGTFEEIMRANPKFVKKWISSQ